MAEESVEKALRGIVSNAWKCLRTYNTKGRKETIHILAQARDQINTLIQHLQS